MIALLPLRYFASRPSIRVLIIGGGDLGACSRALAVCGVESVTVVDIDPEVTSLTKTHFPAIVRRCVEDEGGRVEIIHAPGESFV